MIQLFTSTDHVTNIRQKESSDSIAEDGYFELSFYSEITQPVFLKIDNVVSKLYVQPDFVYGITIPETDQVYDYHNDAELPINIGVISSDTTELNTLTFDYLTEYNKLFYPDNNKYISRPRMFKLADSLKLICDKRYSKIKNDYFKSYYEYSIASINASVSRGENYLISNYINKKPILYHHYEYMQFFNSCFTGYLNTIASTRKGQSLYNIINVKASYELLNDFLMKDKFLTNDSLRELVMIKNLWDFYYSADFAPEAIKVIISDLNIKTKNSEHKKITASMLSYFNKLQPGSAAPNFTCKTRTGNIEDMNQLKGKWIYLNFFSTTNAESLRQMQKIAALKKKMADKIVFVSICLDDSLNAYKNYLKSNPKLDWNIWYNFDKNIKTTAKEMYCVTGTEAYFLINNFGYIAQSPAKSPSGGIEYKLNSIFKPARSKNKTGIR